jgi:hypothetical protein
MTACCRHLAGVVTTVVGLLPTVTAEEPLSTVVTGRVAGPDRWDRVQVALIGRHSYATTTDPLGPWEVRGVEPGCYRVEPRHRRYRFASRDREVQVTATPADERATGRLAAEPAVARHP